MGTTTAAGWFVRALDLGSRRRRFEGGEVPVEHEAQLVHPLVKRTSRQTGEAQFRLSPRDADDVVLEALEVPGPRPSLLLHPQVQAEDLLRPVALAEPRRPVAVAGLTSLTASTPSQWKRAESGLCAAGSPGADTPFS